MLPFKFCNFIRGVIEISWKDSIKTGLIIGQHLRFCIDLVQPIIFEKGDSHLISGEILSKLIMTLTFSSIRYNNFGNCPEYPIFLYKRTLSLYIIIVTLSNLTNLSTQSIHPSCPLPSNTSRPNNSPPSCPPTPAPNWVPSPNCPSTTASKPRAPISTSPASISTQTSSKPSPTTPYLPRAARKSATTPKCSTFITRSLSSAIPKKTARNLSPPRICLWLFYSTSSKGISRMLPTAGLLMPFLLLKINDCQETFIFYTNFLPLCLLITFFDIIYHSQSNILKNNYQTMYYYTTLLLR